MGVIVLNVFGVKSYLKAREFVGNNPESIDYLYGNYNNNILIKEGYDLRNVSNASLFEGNAGILAFTTNSGVWLWGSRGVFFVEVKDDLGVNFLIENACDDYDNELQEIMYDTYTLFDEWRKNVVVGSYLLINNNKSNVSSITSYDRWVFALGSNIDEQCKLL